MESIIVGVLALIGTLTGSWVSHRKSTALIAYRLEELEKKVERHNQVVERTYILEKNYAIIDQKVNEIEKELSKISV